MTEEHRPKDRPTLALTGVVRSGPNEVVVDLQSASDVAKRVLRHQQQLRQVADTHRAFLEAHAALHQHYLELQAHSAARLKAALLAAGPTSSGSRATGTQLPKLQRSPKAQPQSNTKRTRPLVPTAPPYRKPLASPTPEHKSTFEKKHPELRLVGVDAIDDRRTVWFHTEERMWTAADLVTLASLVDPERPQRRLCFYEPIPRTAVTLHGTLELTNDRFVVVIYRDEQPLLLCDNTHDDELSPATERQWHAPVTAAVRCVRESLNAAQVESFRQGETFVCFGPGFERAASQHQSPSLSEQGRYVEEVTSIGHEANAQRSWLRAGILGEGVLAPGALMGAISEATALMFAYLGFTLHTDGWRFVPAIEQVCTLHLSGGPWKGLHVVLREVDLGPSEADMDNGTGIPGSLRIAVDLLLEDEQGETQGWVRNFGLELIPDWPPHQGEDSASLPRTREGLLSATTGRPSSTLGPAYAAFDDGRPLPRLPADPFLFVSRIVRVHGDIRAKVPKAGLKLEAVYEPQRQPWWPPGDNLGLTVLLEVALQPCRWLLLHRGVQGASFLRNQECTFTLHNEVPCSVEEIHTFTRLRNANHGVNGSYMDFDVEVYVQDRRVLSVASVFALLSPAQAHRWHGLPTPLARRASLLAPCDEGDVRNLPLTVPGPLALPPSQPLSLSKVTGDWRKAGSAGLGKLRAEVSLSPRDWAFACHTFGDPTIPTSAMLDPLVQLLRLAMIDRKLGEQVDHPRFESVALEDTVEWECRGALTPEHHTAICEIDITELGIDEVGPFARADGAVWVEGEMIFRVHQLGMRVVSKEAREAAPLRLDSSQDDWIPDYRPTSMLPALPMLVATDILAQAAQNYRAGHIVFKLEKIVMPRWLSTLHPVELRTELELVRGRRSALSLSLFARAADSDDWQAVAFGRAMVAPSFGPPRALPHTPNNTRSLPSPYQDQIQFHGPTFRVVVSAETDDEVVRVLLDASDVGRPAGVIHPILIEGALHVLSPALIHKLAGKVHDHDELRAYPTKIESLALFGPPPTTGTVVADICFDGFRGGPRFPAFDVVYSDGETAWAHLKVVLVLMPTSPMDDVPRVYLDDFVSNRAYVQGAGLSRHDDNNTVLTLHDLQTADWMEGTIHTLYAPPKGLGRKQLGPTIAIKDHVARLLQVHPSSVQVDLETEQARCDTYPHLRVPIVLDLDVASFHVRSAVPPSLDGAAFVKAIPNNAAGRRWLRHDIARAAAHHCLSLVFDPSHQWSQKRGIAIWVTRRRWAIEPLLWSSLLPALAGAPLRSAGPEPSAEWMRWLAQTLSQPAPAPWSSPSAELSPRDLLLQASERGEHLVFDLEDCDDETYFVELSEVAAGMQCPLIPFVFHSRVDVPMAAEVPDSRFAWELAAAPPLEVHNSQSLGAVLDGIEAVPQSGLGPEAEAMEWRESIGMYAENRDVPVPLAWLLKLLQHTPAPSDDAASLIDAMATGELLDGPDPHSEWLRGVLDTLLGNITA